MELIFWSGLSPAKSIQAYFSRVQANRMKTVFELAGSVVREQIQRYLKAERRKIDFFLHLNVQKKVIRSVILKYNLIPLI